MNSPSHPDLSIAGEISELAPTRYEEALWPFLRRHFPGDPRLAMYWKDELCELRIYATDFDMMIYDGLITCGYNRGSYEEAVAFLRELSAVFTQHRISHSFEIMYQEPNGEWSDVLTIP